MNGNVQVGSQAGEIIVDDQVVKLVDWQHRPIYDTVEFNAAALAIGNNFVFTNLGTKDKRLTNLSQAGQMPSDWEMIVLAIMIEIKPNDVWANLTVDNIHEDIHNIYHSMYFEMEVGQTTLVAQGMLQDFPYPYGQNVASMVSQDNIAAATTIDYITVNNGATHGRPRPLATPIHVTKDLTFRGNVQNFVAFTTNEPWHVRVVLDALVKRPVR